MLYWLHRIKYGPWFKWKRYLFDIHLYSLKAADSFHNSKVCSILFKLGLYTFNYDSPIGLYLWLSSPKDFEDIPDDKLHTNLRSLAGKCKAHLFQKAKGYGSKTGYFIGILYTHEDLYYILMDDNGNKWYETCCSKLEFLKD